MAPIGKLYGHPKQPGTIAILSAAAISGLEIETPPFEFGVTNKDPDFVHKFPLAKIPAFEDIEGFKMIEGAAIARYVSSLVPESGLLGRNAKETALVDQWVHFAESEVILPTRTIYYAIAAKVPPGYTTEQHEFRIQRTNRSLQYLEDYLATCHSRFIVNDSITLADLFVAGAAVCAGMTVCGAAQREKAYPHIFAHQARVTADERIKVLFGQPEFINEPLAIQAE